ncbi:MAG: ABC transporter substrate-binding protein [Alphaproteobacteria bacterium]|nr:ABC transporter substrate-binding protein [Alphaproteobacteria bacterium]MBV9153314.1 ABC transporter substrate-binding protein [Alphaproteobacteria bacterium]
MRRSGSVLALAAGLAATVSLAGNAGAQDKTLIIGMQCDRTGATQIVGTVLCPAMHDYYNLVNSQGGIDGWKIKHDEIDNGYKVPDAVEAYQRQKQEGAILMTLYGTPQTVALNQRLEEDHIPTTSPGFGISAAADGTRYPYLFPIAATYWSQGAAAIKFAKDKLGGDLHGKKIAYVYYDNPAGKEPIPIIEALQKQEGFELRTFAVPPPGVEMGAQALDVTQRYKPDFIIDHLFGRSPSVSIKEYKRLGYPLSKVLGLVWASAEADILAAGGWQVADGYNTLQFAGAGDDYPVRQDIKAMYKKDGKDPPKEMDDTVIYNRGLLQAAIHVEALKNALKISGGKQPTGEDVKKGMEQISNFTLGGLVPPLHITPTDHEGGGWVQIFQVKGGKFAKETDWLQAYRDVVQDAVKHAE